MRLGRTVPAHHADMHPAAAVTSQVKAGPTPRSSTPGAWGSAWPAQAPCAASVVGRCQQGCTPASASVAHSLKQQPLPASCLAAHSAVLQHGSQSPQALQLQQAPRLTAALDLQQQQQPQQQARQHVQQWQQQEQQHGSYTGPLQWLANGHTPPRDVQQQQQHGHAQQPPLVEHLQRLQQQHQQDGQDPTQLLDGHNWQQQQLPAAEHAVKAAQQETQQPLQQHNVAALHHDEQQLQPQQHQQVQQQGVQELQQQQQPAAEEQQQRQRPQLVPAQITGLMKWQHSVQQLQHIYQQHGHCFNAINFSALLSRLAHIHDAKAADPAAAAEAQRLALHAMQQLVLRLGECSSSRQAANATWALAVLQCRPPQELLHSTAQQLTAQQGHLLQSSQPQDLANLAWGLTKLQYDPACRLWPLLAAAAHRQLARFKPGELAMLMWALADTQQRLQQLRQQQQHRQQQMQWRRAQQARQQQQQQQFGAASSVGSRPAWRQPNSEEELLSVQQAARRQSHAEASTSTSTSLGSSPTAAQGSSSTGRLTSSGSSNSYSGNRGSGQRRLSFPMRSVAQAAPAIAAGSQGRVRSDNNSSSSSRPTGSRSSSLGGGSAAQQAQQASGSSLWHQLQQLLPAVAELVPQQLEAGQQPYGAKESALLLWACAVLGFRHEGLVTALSGQQQQHLQQGRSNSQDVSNSVWAAAKLQLHQPALLAAAAQHTAWLRGSSCQELSMVLYGSAAVIRQQRQRHCSSNNNSNIVLVPAVALWQAAAAHTLESTALQDCGAAEAATLLRAAALLLEPLRRRGSRVARQLQQQPTGQQGGSGSMTSSSSSNGTPTSSGTAADSNGSSSSSSSTAGSDSSSSSAVSSMCSMTCSLDGLDEPYELARQLVAAVDAAVRKQAAAGSLAQPLSGQHVASLLHSLAAARTVPSAAFMQLLLSSATAATAGMDGQELAMTAWAVAKLQGTARSSEAAQQLVEAVDRAAAPLLPSMSPQQLSMLAWAHAKLWDLGDSLFMHQLAQAALQQVGQFGPQALSNLTWAFAQLRHYDAALTAAVGRRVRALMVQFTPAELANLTWALVALRHRHAGMLRAIAGHAAGACSSWDPKACVKLATAYCSKGMATHRYRGLLAALADALEAKSARAWALLTPHELVQLAVALAVGRVRHRACTAQVAALGLAWLPRLSLCDMVSLVWALAMAEHRSEALLQAVSSRIAAMLQPGGDVAAGHPLQHLPQQQSQPLHALQQQEQQEQQEPHGSGLPVQPLPGCSSAEQLPVVGASRAHAMQQLLQYAQGNSCLSGPTGIADAAAGVDAGSAGPSSDSSSSGSGDGSSSNGSNGGGSSSSSALSAVPISAVVGRLKAHHLARLAWSYKSFGHADANWYLAAGQLVATSWDHSHSQLRSSLQGTVGASSSSSADGNGSSSSGSSREVAGRLQQQGAAGTTRGRDHVVSAVNGNGRHGFVGSSSIESGLQRPPVRPMQAVYRQVQE